MGVSTASGGAQFYTGHSRYSCLDVCIWNQGLGSTSCVKLNINDPDAVRWLNEVWKQL